MSRAYIPEVSWFWRVAMVTMERRERPIRDVRDMPMLDRVEPAIVDVVLQVALIANEMFPVSALPDPALAARFAYGTALLAFRDGFREPDFNPAPADGKI